MHRLRPALDLMGRLDPANAHGRATRSTISAAAPVTSRASWPSVFPRRGDRRRRFVGGDARQGAHARPPTSASPSPRAISRISSPASRPASSYSNAAYHWIEGHIDLFPGLLKLLPSGGQLAIQMPRNHEAPSHALMRKAAEAGPWRDKLASVRRHPPGRGAGALLRRAEAALLRPRGLGDDLPAIADRQGSGGAIHGRHRAAALHGGAGRAERTGFYRDLRQA